MRISLAAEREPLAVRIGGGDGAGLVIRLLVRMVAMEAYFTRHEEEDGEVELACYYVYMHIYSNIKKGWLVKKQCSVGLHVISLVGGELVTGS